MSEVGPVTASSRVTLREITAKTVRAIAALSVTPEQRHLVASNALSLAEANFNGGAWFRAIQANDTPVGFIMLFDPTLPGAVLDEDTGPDEVWLWRFMIDLRYQHLGFGRQALDLAVDYARGRPGITGMAASYVPGPQSPRAFYIRYGFRETGRTCAKGTENHIYLPL